MDKIDKAAARLLSSETQKALEAVAAKHGLTVTISGGKYDPGTGTYEPRVKYAMADAGRKAFERSARLVGLTPEDFGATFKPAGVGQEFKLTGINLRAPKYPIQAVGLQDGKSYKFPEGTVTRALKRDTADPVTDHLGMI